MKAGDRVRMVGTMREDPAPMEVGAEGTIEEILPRVGTMPGQILVDWDNGRGLILLTTDPFIVLPTNQPTRSDQ